MLCVLIYIYSYTYIVYIYLYRILYATLAVLMMISMGWLLSAGSLKL